MATEIAGLGPAGSSPPPAEHSSLSHASSVSTRTSDSTNTSTSTGTTGTGTGTGATKPSGKDRSPGSSLAVAPDPGEAAGPSDGPSEKATEGEEDAVRSGKTPDPMPALPSSRSAEALAQAMPAAVERPAGGGPAVTEEGELVAAKKLFIYEACVNGDVGLLQQLAASEGGFLTDGLRQIAWAVLLGIPVGDDGHIDVTAAHAAASIPPSDDSTSWEALPPHRDEEQVQLDVNRAFVHYPRHDSNAEEVRQKKALSALIVEVLRRQPFLCYFQGFHDICQVFLLVLPAELRTPAVLRLAVLRIRDFMLPTIDAAVQQLQLLPDILRVADPPLWNHLRLAQHPRPFFALSGTLTMYAHDVESLGAIARLFDVLLARPPAFSLYLFAAIACAHRSALFATPADEPEMLHHILSKLPGLAGGGGSSSSSKGAPSPSLDELIAAADRLAADHPPHTLPAWRAIPAASVLKTAAFSPLLRSSDLAAPAPPALGMTMADGERLFHEHVRALARAERRRQQAARARTLLRQYRGPLRAAGAAVLVAVVAVTLRRSGSGSGVSAWLARLVGF